jgi:hypothetical protein
VSGNKFNLIAQEISKQYQVLEELKLENRRLHEQLTDLREGRGIFVEVEGHRFAVNVTTISPLSSQRARASTAASAPIAAAAVENVKPTPLTKVGEKTDEEQAEIAPVEKTVKRSATFLEEIMLDEFANALTSPTARESASSQKATPPSEAIDEDQKAVLRKELLGSYLLE